MNAKMISRASAMAICICLSITAQERARKAVDEPAPPLPRAEDVLPPDEVSRGSLVVTGEGFRFQVRPEHHRIADPRSAVAYRGIVKGILEPAETTLYASRERFSGSLQELVKRETNSAVAHGGTLSENSPVKLAIQGRMGDAHRFLVATKDVIEVRVMAVHEGYAYMFHAETPRTPNAFANVGSNLMIYGSTFHVAPPK